MNKFSAFILITLLAGLAMPATAGADRPVRLTVRIFQVPADQGFAAERTAVRGGTYSLQATGNVTALFPHGTVFVPTELAGNASESSIGRTIGESIPFGNLDLLVDRVQVRELKALDIRLDATHFAEEARFEESRGEGRKDDYELRIERIPGGTDRPLVRFRFFAGWSAQAGSLGTGMSWDVISTVAEVPESKLLLIGALGDKAAYFLAVCAESR